MEQELKSYAKIRFGDCDPNGHLNNVKYLEYMLNAREDHVEKHYGFTYEEYAKKTGCIWVSIQNEIAYFKELLYNETVLISSKTIHVDDRITKVEILIKSEDEKTIHAVLWMTVIYFNLKTRKSDVHPKETLEQFSHFVVDIDQTEFSDRVKYLRRQNKS